jgi:hypothetical protein
MQMGALTRCRLRLAIVSVLAMLAAPVAHARVDPPHPTVDPRHIDGSELGGPIDLSSTWLLKQGDDPGFADPKLDDRDWLAVSAARPLSTYGLKDINVVWYRTHVHLPAEAHNLAVILRFFAGSERTYANGVEIGSSGPAPQGGVAVVNTSDRLYPIPDSALSDRELTIAIRAEIGRFTQGGRTVGGVMRATTVLLGTRPDLQESASLMSFRNFTSNGTNTTLAVVLLLIALALALTLRSEKEYLALVFYMAMVVGKQVFEIWRGVNNAGPTLPIIVPRVLLEVLGSIALMEFVRLVLGLRRTRLLTGYMIALFLLSIPLVVLVYEGYLGARTSGSHYLLVFNLVIQVLFAPADVGLPLVALWAWWKHRKPDALLLFVPLFLQVVYSYYNFILSVLFQMHLAAVDAFSSPPVPALYVQWSEITTFLFSVALLIFLVLRTLRLARARAEVAAEIEAAKTVQQVLLARSSQPTPGFRVESIYHPANEVGGDFFLVSPGPDGSLTAIVGDVSGKGLLAAMRVSMILGVLRREEARYPAEVLRGLNAALLTQGEMGFTTACCVRLERNGHFTLANAGHIPPYVDGMEIGSPPSLPLGLIEDEVYTQVDGLLPPGKRLVLMSDGVVEARSATGELYGFDRLASLTLMPAHDIADVAQRFGQDDDITVLTIACAF